MQLSRQVIAKVVAKILTLERPITNTRTRSRMPHLQCRVFSVGPGQVGLVAGESWKLNAWLCMAVIPPPSQATASIATGRTVPRNTLHVQGHVSGSFSPSITVIVITKEAIPEKLPNCFSQVMRYIPSGSLERPTALVLGVPPMILCAVHYLAPR